MRPTFRDAVSGLMLTILFLVGLLPLAVNVAANLVTDRDVHLFPWWFVGAGVVVSLVIANRADDKVSASATQLGKAAKGWLPWAKNAADTEEVPVVPPVAPQ